MSQIAEIIEGRPLIHADASENVREVAQRMSNGNVGAVAVLDGGRLVGRRARGPARRCSRASVPTGHRGGEGRRSETGHAQGRSGLASSI